ncbi:MAG: CoA ester lyase [Bacteroidetes bacterium]|nr:CoA ester lyase [Bacteroidota bacterium]
MELLRTMLFVPGNRQRMIEKARGLTGLDAIVFDLEDAVPPVEKPSARRMVRDAMDSGDFNRFKLFVRVNAVSTNLLPDDLDAIVSRNLFGIVLPKVEDPEGVESAHIMLLERERRAGLTEEHTKILPIIETVPGVLGLPRIAGCSGRFVGLSFGAEDFATDLGVERSRDGIEGLYPRVQIALYSRLTGVTAVDSVFSDVNDDEGMEKDTLRAKQLGFRGKFLVHPRQIEVAKRIFTPSEKEVEYARQVVAAYEDAEARGEASVALNGKMVDIPIVERARALLVIAEKLR